MVCVREEVTVMQRAGNKSRSRGAAHALDSLYKEANDLIQNNDINNDTLSKLGEIRKRIEKLPRQTRASPIPNYTPLPDIDDGDFNQTIFQKKEFNEHQALPMKPTHGKKDLIDAAWKSACSTSEFNVTHYQLFLRNFLSPTTPYNAVLLYHDVGTGKTCSSITIAEQFRSTHKIVVLTSPGLRDSFKQQIFDIKKVKRHPDGSIDMDSISQCTGNRYISMVPHWSTLTPEDLDKKISKIIHDQYSFFSAGDSFANMVDSYGEGDAADERIRKAYSNTVFIVDEAHHLRTTQGTSYKRVTPALKRVLRVTEGCKLVLLTATPMYNDARDIIDLINLMRTADKRKPVQVSDFFDGEGNITSAGRGRLLDACRGYISYMKGSNPYSFPVRLYPSVNRDNAVLDRSKMPLRDAKGDPISKSRGVFDLVASPMHGTHYALYKAYMDELQTAQQDPADIDVDVDEDVTVKSYNPGLEVSNIMLPVKSGRPFGMEAFSKCFRRATVNHSVQFEYNENTPEFLDLKDGKLNEVAPKMATILQRVSSCQGIALIYSKFLWSGLVPMAIALEHAGFTRYNSMPLLARGSMAGRNLGRYAIICGDRDLSSDIQTTVDSLRSLDNIDGKLIKVILISDKGSEGIDLKFIREVHIMEPWYHFAKLEQVIGRATRHCSHAALPLEKRNVTIYYHVAVANDPRVETIDMRAYRIAEQKLTKIHEVDALIRQSAIDCNINLAHISLMTSPSLGAVADMITSQNTNVRGGRVGDAAANALTLTCAPSTKRTKKSGPVDDTTYSPKDHAFNMHTYNRVLRDVFVMTTSVSISFDTIWKVIHERIPNARRDFLSLALDNFITSHTQLFNSKGQSGNIIFRGGMYLFQPDTAPSMLLSDWERSRPPMVNHRLVSSMESSTGAKESSKALLNRQLFESKDVAWKLDDLDGIVRSAVQSLSIAMSRSLPSAFIKRQMQQSMIDYVVDRFSSLELQRAAVAVLGARESGGATDIERSVLLSMQNAGLIRDGDGGITHVYDPYIQKLHCYDTDTRSLAVCNGGARMPAKHDGIVAFMHPVYANGGRAQFKLVTNQSKPTKGCVCHQTSTITVAILHAKIRELLPKTMNKGNKNDKMTLCTVYELLLRKYAPRKMLRPAAAQAWLRGNK